MFETHFIIHLILFLLTKKKSQKLYKLWAPYECFLGMGSGPGLFSRTTFGESCLFWKYFWNYKNKIHIIFVVDTCLQNTQPKAPKSIIYNVILILINLEWLFSVRNLTTLVTCLLVTLQYGLVVKIFERSRFNLHRPCVKQ